MLYYERLAFQANPENILIELHFFQHVVFCVMTFMVTQTFNAYF